MNIKANCSGCSACASVCPKECTKMEYNEDGFLRPFTDEKSCIHCDLCEKVCPMECSNAVSLDAGTLYAAWGDVEDQKKSSSGGIAAKLACYAVSHGYEVCGAALDYDTVSVKHKVVSRMDELEALRGSKYLQSNVLNAFYDMFRSLKNSPEQKFFAFGTPCQIAGLRNVLEQKHLLDRVALIDIFCHGVPTNHLWEKYKNWIVRKMKLTSIGDIKNITFRDKTYSWHEYYMHIVGGGTAYVEHRGKDPFLKLFSMGVVNQESCFTCPFRNKSSADIRLGDYWGNRFKDNEEGVSMVIVNNSIGQEILNAIRDEITITKQDIKDRFGQQHTDYEYPKYYKRSLEMLNDSQFSFEDVINLYETDYDRFKRTIKNIIKKILHI